MEVHGIVTEAPLATTDEKILAGTTRLELANQLIENQPAFHFAFVPMVFGARGEIRTLRKN